MTAEGKHIKIQRNIFSECFYVLGMSEMYRASKIEIYKVNNSVNTLLELFLSSSLLFLFSFFVLSIISTTLLPNFCQIPFEGLALLSIVSSGHVETEF